MKKVLSFFILFLGCIGTFAQYDTWYRKEVNGIFYECHNITNTSKYYATVVSGGSYSGNIVIPDSITSEENTYNVTSIGSRAFYGCTGLTSITIPNSVTSIRKEAFSNCTGLTSVTIPNSVTYMESHIFSGCTGLTSITIPNSVTSIEKYTFSGCSGLTSVTIPNSINSIGEGAFAGCTSLTRINISDLASWYERSWGRRFSSSTYSLYLNDKKISNLVIPSSITTIGEYAFYNCAGLKSVVIPNSVTTIGEYAFHNCTGLTSLTIPNSVTSMGGNAFTGCTEITDITFLTQKPFAIGYVFSCQNYATLHVLERYIPVFQSLEGWKDFYFIEGVEDKVKKMDTNGDGNVNTADVVAIYEYIINGE